MPSLNHILCSLMLFASLGLSAGTSIAQQAQAPSEYPTLTALETTIIPKADPVALAQRLRGVGKIPPPPASPSIHQIGEQQDFWVENSTDDQEFQVSATLRVIGEHIYLWVEDGAGINDTDLRALADNFDHSVYDAVRELWGSEAKPGVDGDPRLYGLFAHGLGSGVSAYFLSRHTYPIQVYPNQQSARNVLLQSGYHQPNRCQFNRCRQHCRPRISTHDSSKYPTKRGTVAQRRILHLHSTVSVP